MFARLKLIGKLMVRKLQGVDLTLVTPSGVELHMKSGEEPVVVTGLPSELILFISGRRGGANVKVSGSRLGRELLASASLGM